MLTLTVGPMFAGKSTALLRKYREAVLLGRRPLVVNHELDTRMGVSAVRSHLGDTIACVQTAALMPLLRLCRRPIAEAIPRVVTIVVPSGYRVTYSPKSRGGTVSVESWTTDPTRRRRGGGRRVWSFDERSPLDALDKAALQLGMSGDELLRALVEEAAPASTRDAWADEGYCCVFIDEGQFFADLSQFAIECTRKSMCDVHIYSLDGDYKGRKFGQTLDLVPWANDITKLSGICGVCNNQPGVLSKRLATEENMGVLVGKDDYVQVLVGQDEYVQSCRTCFFDTGREL